MSKSKIVRARIRVGVMPDGSWAAYAWGSPDSNSPSMTDDDALDVITDMLDDHRLQASLRWVAVNIPIPEEPPDLKGVDVEEEARGHKEERQRRAAINTEAGETGLRCACTTPLLLPERVMTGSGIRRRPDAEWLKDFVGCKRPF